VTGPAEPPFRIRTARPEDLEGVVDVYLSLARHHAELEPAAYRVPDRDEARARFRTDVDDPDERNLHLVAEADGQVIGQLDAFAQPPPTPGSMRVGVRSVSIGIAVVDEWRGRGVGTALLAAVENWARHAGVEAIVLDVATPNDAAARLYERLGYREVTRGMTKPIDEG
jgi:RimJ/RimL family protein N-acetyltransferase